MLKIGSIIIILSIIIGFVGDGGNFLVLLQPFEALIIMGSALGILIISTPKPLLRSIWNSLPKIKKGTPYKKQDYVELLVFLYHFFKHTRARNILEIEEHIEKPQQSYIFKEFPGIIRNREATVFFCDYMRMLVLGFENTYELDNMLDEQIQEVKEHTNEIVGAFFRIGDTLPALGIVAAVLGVINAMGSINAEPEILGQKIAAALIGTFLGVALSYCLVSPIGAFLEKYGSDEAKFLECIKAGFMSHARGTPPSISVEVARQAIPVDLKPTFNEVEKAVENKRIKKRGKKIVRRQATRK